MKTENANRASSGIATRSKLPEIPGFLQKPESPTKIRADFQKRPSKLMRLHISGYRGPHKDGVKPRCRLPQFPGLACKKVL